MAILTFVLCSRNDGYRGNSLWRLQTTLNYLAHEASSIGRLEDVEVIVSDWGSRVPLRNAVRLSPEAAKATKFLEVPVDLASERQGDSPFSEVIANNAAIRRARGSFVGRIDQDTLVGSEFLERFFDAVDAGEIDNAPIRDALLFVGRRSVPFRFSSRSPSFEAVVDFVEKYRNVLPREGRGQLPWFDAPVGAMILHRGLWHEYGGYDERLIYWGFMETDLAMRVRRKHPVVDLEPVIGCDFYHLAHSRRRRLSPSRKTNPRVRPTCQSPNDATWGLADRQVRLCHAAPVRRGGFFADSRESEGGHTLDAMAIAGEILWETGMAAYRAARAPIWGDRIS